MSVEPRKIGEQEARLHFLMLEDDPQDVELVRHELSRAGFEYTSAVAQTAAEFGRELDLLCPDVVLGDYSLPQWSGMEALDILHERKLNVPLILVSGALGEETAVECIKKGATDYVLKRALWRLPLSIRRALREKKECERRKMAEELFQRAVESSPSGILMSDESGGIILANAQAAKLFGYWREELIGQVVETLVPEPMRQVHRNHRALYGEAPEARPMGHRRDLACVRKDGSEFMAEIGLTPIQTSSGTQTLIMVVDVSERHEAERAAQEYTLELQRSNAELEQFAYVASHDLQEPLRMVASYTELLGERYRGKLDEQAEKYIGYAVDGARRMQGLIRDLLAYARVSSQAKTLQPTDSQTVLRAAVRNLRATIEKSGAEITCGELPVVSADEGQLMQVFQNLIGNACKFRSQKAPRVEVGAQAAGNMWQFSVVDNGIGIDKESGGRLFQMFQRLHTREEYEGTGIGLAIAKRIVERHGGKIWFDSVPGEGTIFHFTIPRAEPGRHEKTHASAAGRG